MITGLDYAGGRPGGAAIYAAGHRFVVRYLSAGGAGLPGKLLTPAEYADLQAHGIAIAVNSEPGVNTRMRGGAPIGTVDAHAAAAVIGSLGHPIDRPVYFSADWDAQPAEMAAIDAYLRAAAGVLGADRIGVYGGYNTVKHCLDVGSACWAWQTGAWSPSVPTSEEPDRHLVDPRAHLYQRVNSTATIAGVNCDINEARKADFGQHPGGEDDVSATDVWFGVLIANYQGVQVHACDILSATEGRVADLQDKTGQLRTRLEETATAIIGFYDAQAKAATVAEAALMAEMQAIKADLDTFVAAVSAVTPLSKPATPPTTGG